ncbi:MAG: leucine-rich repeat domain-containing protein [Holosporales bacterium]|jgi:hypothetical protein|nr:leucine-rich repeat domain-containing protein [Holosporales bacterium]
MKVFQVFLIVVSCIFSINSYSAESPTLSLYELYGLENRPPDEKDEQFAAQGVVIHKYNTIEEPVWVVLIDVEVVDSNIINLPCLEALRDLFSIDEPERDLSGVVLLSKNVKRIVPRAFSSHTRLFELRQERGGGLEIIEGYSFSDSWIRTITIPATVHTIEMFGLWDGKVMLEVKFENGSRLTELGDRILPGFLRQIVLPQGLKIIKRNAFLGVRGLETVRIPASVQELNTQRIFTPPTKTVECDQSLS